MSMLSKSVWAAVVGLGLSAAATQAAPVESLITVGNNVFSGADIRQDFINNEGDADRIDVGDVIRGIVDFPRLQNANTPPSGTGLGVVSNGTNNELTGVFYLRVEAITPVSGDQVQLTFAPDAAFGGNSPGTMMRLYSGAANVQLDQTATIEQSIATVTDAPLFMELGFTDAGGAWIGFGPQDLSDFNVATVGANSNFGLFRTSDSGTVGGLPLLTLVDPATGLTGEVLGTAQTTGLANHPVPTAWDLTGLGKINFNVNVIPLPAAAWSGLMMLGALGGMYARRRHA